MTERQASIAIIYVLFVLPIAAEVALHGWKAGVFLAVVLTGLRILWKAAR